MLICATLTLLESFPYFPLRLTQFTCIWISYNFFILITTTIYYLFLFIRLFIYLMCVCACMCVCESLLIIQESKNWKTMRDTI